MEIRNWAFVVAFTFLFCGSHGGILSGELFENRVIPRRLDSKGLIASIASSLMARGFGMTGSGSQVVSLNLTNLLVLILLKALIFAAGSIGAGSWKGGFARSSNGEEGFISEEELLLYLTYLTGVPGQNECMKKVACEGPAQARKYAAAGELILKLWNVFGERDDSVYEVSLHELRHASRLGLMGGNCDRYFCDMLDPE